MQQMNTFNASEGRRLIEMGLIGGIVIVYVSVIGMLQSFNARAVVDGWFTLGQLLLFAPPLIGGLLAARRGNGAIVVIYGALVGAVASVPLLIFLMLSQAVDLRGVFVNVNPNLLEILTLEQESVLTGGLMLAGLIALAGAGGALIGLIPPKARRGLLVGVVLLLLPWLLGTFLSEVFVNVGLYILMGFGLNIAVGLAGLLDLGYVTNFAVGAYIMALLTSTGPLGIGDGFNFWLVLPVALIAAMITGFLLAVPVLRMRGDYLAIATLGFGEIIKLLAKSDWLRPTIGGAQGILAIPKPELFGIEFAGPQQLYYIILAACALMLFVSLRLNNSRTGRQWMAIREDEDVAMSMGINPARAKLLAFTLSAASGGLAGAIFAAKVGTVFPDSFDLLVSINVLSLIIVGGMGSVPGIALGAFVLIGLPDLLREFDDFRLLIYGALLVVMMLVRPEGIIPSAVHQREMRAGEDPPPIQAGDVSRVTVQDEHTTINN